MALLTTPYNPTGTVQVLVEAMEAGKRRQAQQEQIIAGLAKAISDDRRHALEFDRLQAFNQAKEAADNAQFSAKFGEEKRRYDDENAVVSLPPRTRSLAPVTEATAGEELDATGGIATGELGAPSGVDLYAAGSPAPQSEGLLPDVAEPTGFADILGSLRADQLKQGLEAVKKIGPDAGEMSNIEQQLAQAMGGGGPMGLPPVSPIRQTDAPNLEAIGLMPPGTPPRADGLPTGKGEPSTDSRALTSYPPPTIGERVYDSLSDVSQNLPGGLRKKDIRAMTPGMTSSAFAAEERARTRGAATAAKPAPVSMQEAIVKYGLTPDPKNGTYRTKDGMEFFIGQGAGGGVSMTPKRPKEEKDRIISAGGNVWLVPPGGGDPRQIIEKGDNLPASVSTKYATALAQQESGRANLDEATRVWEARKADLEAGTGNKSALQKEIADLEKDVQAGQASVRRADALVKSLHEQYPKLGARNADQSPDEKAATLANAKTSMGKVSEAGKAKIRERLLTSGFTEEELQAAGL